MANPYQDAITEAAEGLVAAYADGDVIFKEVGAILFGLLDNAAEIVKVATEFTEDDCNQLIEALQSAYEKYLLPIDIPGIGPFFERIVDRWVRDSLIPSLVHGAHMYFADRGSDES